MSNEKALLAYKYVRKYGKKWTALQTAQFFVAVTRLVNLSGVTTGVVASLGSLASEAKPATSEGDAEEGNMTRSKNRCLCGHVYGDHFPTTRCEHALGCDCEEFRPVPSEPRQARSERIALKRGVVAEKLLDAIPQRCPACGEPVSPLHEVIHVHVVSNHPGEMYHAVCWPDLSTPPPVVQKGNGRPVKLSLSVYASTAAQARRDAKAIIDRFMAGEPYMIALMEAEANTVEVTAPGGPAQSVETSWRVNVEACSDEPSDETPDVQA